MHGEDTKKIKIKDMPIRKKPGEKKDEFVARCIAEEIKSGKSKEQAAAICYTYWEDKQLAAFKRVRKKNLTENFEKIREYVDSSNVDRVMYDTDTLELVVRFNDGSTYTYSGISIDLFNDLLDGVDAPITSGSNKWGSWQKGQSPSVGATLYQRLVKRRVPYKKGGNFR